MPQRQSPFLRAFLTTVLIVGGVLAAFAFYRGTVGKKPAATPETASAATAAQNAQPGATSTATPTSTQPVSQAASPAAGTPTAPAPTPAQSAAPTAAPPLPAGWTLQPLVYASQSGAPVAGIGSVDRDNPAKLRAEFSNGGAGIKSLRVNRHYTSIREEANVPAQEEVAIAQGQAYSALVPFSALAIEVSPVAAPGQVATPISVNLYANTGGPIWKSDAAKPGVFEATIVDGAGAPVLRVTRAYEETQGSSLTLRQRVDNLSPFALSVRWFQMGPVDLAPGTMGYGGDKRHLRMGYLLPPSADPTQQQVVAEDYHYAHRDLLGKRNAQNAYDELLVWPTERSTKAQHALVWAAVMDRYYGAAIRPVPAPGASGKDLTLAWVDHVTRVVADGGPGHETAGLRLDSVPLALAPAGGAGASADLSLGIFAGPLDKHVIRTDAQDEATGLSKMIVYNFGGPCGFCTFPFMTQGILSLLHVLHDYVVKDWAVAIILLVVVVRSILHPVTKWSQIKIARFGKQMQGLAPKQKEIQAKFKDDPKKLQVEMANLWRSEGVSPAGMLGCVPMFLQMPVWIALSATLYFAVELRHQGAFYGVFQSIFPKASPVWQFLGDLAEPDRLLYVGRTLFTAPLLGPIEGLNILPLILGVVFYIQQKVTPQPTQASTPEQEMQMKMMKWMSVFMFPLFMYNAPSGLAIYFTANSVLAILESKWIRHHMEKHGLLDLDKMKQERQAKRAAGSSSGGGFMDRVQKAIEAKQQEAARQQMRGKEKR